MTAGTHFRFLKRETRNVKRILGPPWFGHFFGRPAHLFTSPELWNMCIINNNRPPSTSARPMWRRHSENDKFCWQIQGRKLMIAVSGEHRHDAYQLLIFEGVLGTGIFSWGILSNRIATINGHYLTCIISAPTRRKRLKAWLNRLWRKKCQWTCSILH